MKKITLPKWAVLQSLDHGRLIHIGNGEFVSADAHTPKVIETCAPSNAPKAEKPPATLTPEDTGDYQVQWVLGQIDVDHPDEPEPEVPTA